MQLTLLSITKLKKLIHAHDAVRTETTTTTTIMKQFSLIDGKPNPKLSQLPIRSKANIIVSQGELMVKTASQLEARENASDRVGIGFGFAFDWLSKRCDFSRPFTEQR